MHSPACCLAILQAMLSIGAAMLGAQHVVGVDVDDDALQVAQQNVDEYDDPLPVRETGRPGPGTARAPQAGAPHGPRRGRGAAPGRRCCRPREERSIAAACRGHSPHGRALLRHICCSTCGVTSRQLLLPCPGLARFPCPRFSCFLAPLVAPATARHPIPPRPHPTSPRQQIDFIRCDVRQVAAQARLRADTVLMNPPFGTRRKGGR